MQNLWDRANNHRAQMRGAIIKPRICRHLTAQIDREAYFDYCRNTGEAMPAKPSLDVTRYADMLSAMGTEPRLRIIRLLLAAHPEGMFVGEITEELEIPSSTLSHHLDKLKNEDLVTVQREGTFLRYRANTQA